MRLLAALLVPLLGPLLCGQTFVVDKNNGPGTHFTSITAAIAAVPSGAVLEIRAGNYFEGLGINGKSLTIVGAPGAAVFPNFAASFRIENLTTNQVVVVRGLRVGFTQGVNPTVYCSNNQGMVFLDDMQNLASSSLVASQCSALWLSNCRFLGIQIGTTQPGMQLVDCTTVLDACTVTELVVYGGATQLASTAVAGRPIFGVPGFPAATMNGGALRVLGGSLTGNHASGGAIAGTGSVRIDPVTTIAAAAPQFGAGITTTTATMPYVRTTASGGGTTVTATLAGPGGEVGAVFVGLRSLPQSLPGADPVWLEVPTMLLAGVAVLGASPLQTVTQLPPSPGYTGLAVVWQGVSIDAAGSLQLSNPSWILLP